MLGLLVLAIGCVHIILTRDRNNLALFYAGYLTALEVYLRMTSGVIFYEYGKYAVIIILGIGIYYKRELNSSVIVYFFYLLLLLIGISMADAPTETLIRKQIAFNLSGPFVLGLSAIYFYKINISKQVLLNSLYYMLLPVCCMLGLLYVKTPDIRQIAFSGAANVKMSGGFGPNQVATILGFGFFLIMVLISQKKKITGVVFLDILISAYLFYRGIMTFSRGGILTAFIAFGGFLFFSLLDKGKFVVNLVKYLAVGSVVVVSVWIYSTAVTNGMILNRFTGKNASGTAKEDITSGRIDIILEQLGGFYESPILGIGVGNGKYRRLEEYNDMVVASHNEVFRLIEEHGTIGLFLLLLLITVPLINMYYSSLYAKGFLLAFYLFWFLTISHSAMRIAFPGFIYGLSLIHIRNDDPEEFDDNLETDEIE
ncbi:O-antigen ligase family protein [Flavicella sediminum]|uniref:O-antigen ligase family protein n=1 Tax=Flavicella sediminum TaxID=2585141 RepID=UPI0011215E74|nr:O-antigen ligase family protein [Flavicella sediminum]